jgi:hypothetical protein
MPAMLCVGPRAGTGANRHGGRPWAGGAMRWQFASASQRRPRAVNDARWRRSKTPAVWSEVETASDNGL